uniref:Uncharacterized protein C1orf43 homolog isoform X1 n=1 Tax=Geotrypetes seraphini TaxID=260995 RepID=A0A6P8PD02_GEOSA|nr:uncharacterized protein C1orf43 homolog isoform X1 [Geotrypetes seraphini]
MTRAGRESGRERPPESTRPDGKSLPTLPLGLAGPARPQPPPPPASPAACGKGGGGAGKLRRSLRAAPSPPRRGPRRAPKGRGTGKAAAAPKTMSRGSQPYLKRFHTDTPAPPARDLQAPGAAERLQRGPRHVSPTRSEGGGTPALPEPTRSSGVVMASSNSNWLSGVNVVLVMAYGSLVFVLLFIFVKRQIMRFAMKSRRGPHVPVGHNAPKDLKEEIDIRLSKVQDVKCEPQLLADDDERLLQLETQRDKGCYNYLYRMKTLDAIRSSEIPFHDGGRFSKPLLGKNFRSYLVELRNSSTPFKGVRKVLIDTLLDGYDAARYGTGVFGKSEYLRYQQALNEVAAIIKARGIGSLRQHQFAAKDLTVSPEASSTPTIQVTYLPSSQKSKRAKHFLELKSFKDNYNTLESTL